MYAKVTECVLFHKDILRYELGQLIVPFKKLDPTFHSFGDEVQDIFQGSIFAQVCASVIIICMTLLQATGDDVTMADLLGCGFYLLVMTSQVFIFCYVGNEISYTVGWTRRGIKCLGRISIPNSMMFRYRRINLQSLLGFPTTSSSISVPAKQWYFFCKCEIAVYLCSQYIKYVLYFRTLKDVHIKVGSVLKVTLNLHTFLQVCNYAVVFSLK